MSLPLDLLHALGQALWTAFSLFWEILWPLILGFALSGIVQAVVSHQSLAKTLGCDGPKCLTFATLFGIASSSCFYAAVALARSIFQKGTRLDAAMIRYNNASRDFVFGNHIKYALPERTVRLCYLTAQWYTPRPDGCQRPMLVQQSFRGRP